MFQRNLLLYIVTLTVQTVLVFCENDQESNQSKFPDIFFMDNYYECSKLRGSSYCTANMNLIPKDAKSELWKQIENHSILRNHFNRTVIHRTLCIPSIYKYYLEKRDFIERKTNEELKVYQLGAKMFSMDCKEEEDLATDITGILISISLYMGLIIGATIYDQIGSVSDKQSRIGKWLVCFSVKSNWNKLTSEKNPDYQRLKCIQGVRTYQTVLVISCHVLMANGQTYMQNTSFIEKMYKNPFSLSIIKFFMYIIQTYFVLSTWLLTNQILELYKKTGRFSIRDGVVLFFHRVTRFWAPMICMMSLGVRFAKFASGPGNFEIVNILSRTCRNKWWATFFHVTNFLDISEVCNLGMWSLSLDTQFYIVCIVFLHVALNYHLDIKTCLAYLFIFTYILNAVMFYIMDFPILAWIDVNHLKRIDFFQSKTIGTTYVGFWINMGSSLIGILFGYFYFLRKHDARIVAFDKLYGPIFAIIPITAVLMGSMDCSKLISVLLGPLLKPLFAFGIACGIYGMTRNVIEGWAKSICENKYAILLGNFTFSTYIYHFLVVFSTGAKRTSLVELSLMGMGISCLIDVVKSFAVGIFCALMIEQPGINVKNMVLPRIKREKGPSEEQCKSIDLRMKIKIN